jgi:predicted nuclease of predicted toxin-antitoxin system
MLLCRWLAARGHEASHVHEVGLGGAADAEIAAHAESEGATLISKDEDFLILRQPDRFGLLWLRCGNTTDRALGLWLEERWERVEEPHSGAEGGCGADRGAMGRRRPVRSAPEVANVGREARGKARCVVGGRGKRWRRSLAQLGRAFRRLHQSLDRFFLDIVARNVLRQALDRTPDDWAPSLDIHSGSLRGGAENPNVGAIATNDSAAAREVREDTFNRRRLFFGTASNERKNAEKSQEAKLRRDHARPFGRVAIVEDNMAGRPSAAK